VLVVASERDYWPVAVKEAYARRMKRAEVAVVADAGHVLPIEAPERFNDVLVAFLDRQGADVVRSGDASSQEEL
jgi:3-oxoadipate enol-lactonase